MKALNLIDQTTVDRAKAAVTALVELAQPRGKLAECKHRGEVSSRGKWLLAAITKLEAEIEARK